jgi:hypothetical protein
MAMISISHEKIILLIAGVSIPVLRASKRSPAAITSTPRPAAFPLKCFTGLPPVVFSVLLRLYSMALRIYIVKIDEANV